tara:strand:+ start:667977 stop:669014 length:1038 start_codon:yes stop_codon:yes gene_type:complete
MNASNESTPLEKLGWQKFFAQQISADENETNQTQPVRVIEVHRSGLHVLGDNIDMEIPPGLEATVGDWLLLNPSDPASSTRLQRKSLFKRVAPGTTNGVQLIAANVDTAFIVSSCNQDFNVARLERYLALAFEADVTPIILLTKADLCEDSQSYLDAAKAISEKTSVILINALSDEPQAKLGQWCGAGQMVAFLGSSGVGKSSLVNALLGNQAADTGSIREDDSKGRHTTTHRQIHFTANGCAILDTPGMRGLQLANTQEGIADVFADIFALAEQCRFNDCKHETEPGCAIQAAVKANVIDQPRIERWNKLIEEELSKSTSLGEQKSNNKSRRKASRALNKKNKK